MDQNEKDSAETLRTRAERRVRELLEEKSVAEMSPAEGRELIRELRIHQVELEIQNEELRHAQHELEVARDRFRDLYDFAPVGYLTSTREGRIRDVNLTAARMLGLPRPALTASRLYRFVAEEDKEAFLAHQRALMERGEHSCEVRLVGETGAGFRARLDCVAEQDGSGSVVGFRTAITDVTAQRECELRWQVADAVLEAASEGIVVLDSGGCITRINRAFAEITGHRREDISGQPFTSVLAGDEDAGYLDAAWREIQHGRRWTGELGCRRADGETFPARLSLSPVANARGRLAHVAGLLEDVTAAKQSEEEMRLRAYYDGITGLPNRTLLGDRLAEAVKEAHRHGTLLGLLFLDLDRFKQANDELGHAAGDSLLRAVADRLTACVREHDTVARVGGDEFAVLLPDVQKAQSIATVAGKINEALSTELHVEGVDALIGASIGIAVYPSDTRDLETLRRYADLAMYRAKTAGPNTFRFYDPSMTEQAVTSTRIRQDIGRGLSNNEFCLSYQPIIRASTGTIAGAEALLRWRHPERGLLGPEEFLSVAEETGQIQRLGEWVIEQVCRDTKSWLEGEADAPPFVSVNVSVRQVMSPAARRCLVDAFRRCGLPPGRLAVEMADRALLEGESIEACVKGLREIGVRLIMDDFGVGYSPVGLLRQLPFDMVKIARSLVAGIGRDRNAEHAVEGLIRLADGLGLEAVGEGVETKDQFDFLRKSGCGCVQGVLFGPPVRSARFMEQLKHGFSA
ncbi:MAG: EAL domain-containing protein [Ectothiorhodospiraceae bacterium]